MVARTGGVVSKIDDQSVNGLLGANNSLAYKVHEIEKHLHNSEYWYGDGGGNAMTRAANHNPWTLTANVAANTYGTEVQIASADDFLTDMADAVKMDFHKVLVTASSVNDKNYMIQFWSGTGAFGAAEFLTEVPYRTGGNAAEVVPVSVLCPRFGVADKVWARVKCETGSATIDFIAGLHGYTG